MMPALSSWLDLPARAGRRATLAQLGVAAASGLLTVLASPPFGLWPLGWIAFAPLLWLVSRAPRASRAGLYGWACGFTISLVGFHWFVFPFVDHTGVPWPAAIALLLAFAAYQGLALLLAARAIWWARAWAHRRGRWLPLAAIAPAAVVGFEHAQPVIFPYTIAISQAPALPVIQIADVLGAPAVAALLVAVAAALVDVVLGSPDHRRAARRAAAAVAVALAATLGYGAWRIADVDATRAAAPVLRVGLVQPNERMDLGHHDPDADAALLAAMQEATARLQAAGADLVVWSEASYPADLPRDLGRDLPETSPWRIRRGFKIPVVIGALTQDRTAAGARRRYNSAFLLAGDDVVARHDKLHRVLGSEWNPVVEWFPSLAAYLPPGFSGGDEPVILPAPAARLGRTVRLGAMICMEDVVASFGRDVAARHPDLLVNLTNDSWFGAFAEPLQHRALAQFRAIEARADMVRAVNTGPTGWIDATGRVRAQLPIRDGGAAAPETLLVEVRVLSGGRTIYAAIGDLFAWACLALALAGWLLGRRGRARPAARPARGHARKARH